MGKGNYYTDDGSFIYVERNNNEDYDLDRSEYDDLVENIRSKLPKSYSQCWKWGTEGRIIAENSLCEILLVDNQWSYALVFSYGKLYKKYADNLVPLAKRHIEQVADKIFDSIADMYPCYERGCAWTSKKYEKRKVA
ncbi:MAG: hypothetical protein PHE93_06435 [Clostridia bacterium]|nr:hypothetical protein [Clostridia bacterium]